MISAAALARGSPYAAVNHSLRRYVSQDMWEFNGLPLHPLVVHAAVVLGPLAALAALAYVGWPKHRDLLRWVALVTVLLATASIWAAYLTSTNFFSHAHS